MSRRKDADCVWILRPRRGPRRVDRFTSGIEALTALEQMPEVTLIAAADQLADISWRGFLAQAARARPLALRVLVRASQASAHTTTRRDEGVGSAGAGSNEVGDHDHVDSIIDTLTDRGLEELAAIARHTQPLRERLLRSQQQLELASRRLEAARDAQRALLDTLAGTVDVTASTLAALLPSGAAGGQPARLLRVWRRWLGVIDLAEGRTTAELAFVRLGDLVDNASSAAHVAVHVDARSADATINVDPVLTVRVLALLLCAVADLGAATPLMVFAEHAAVRLPLAPATTSSIDIERALAGAHPTRPMPLWAVEVCLARHLGEHARIAIEVRRARGHCELVLLAGVS